MPKRRPLDLHLKKGALHEQLGIPAGQKIPSARLASAANSDNALLARRAKMAETMSHWNKG